MSTTEKSEFAVPEVAEEKEAANTKETTEEIVSKLKKRPAESDEAATVKKAKKENGEGDPEGEYQEELDLDEILLEEEEIEEENQDEEEDELPYYEEDFDEEEDGEEEEDCS